MHTIVVSSTKYDQCEAIRTLLANTTNQSVIQAAKRNVLKESTWTTIPLPKQSIANGIPGETRVKLRVNIPYAAANKDPAPNVYPLYRFNLDKLAMTGTTTESKDEALNLVNVVPNPYYAYSAYETSATTGIVKITNLPPKATVTIYALDGRFIRQYNRNEVATAKNQVTPAIEWDLKNAKGIPIASGMYLIHIKSDEGERILKWFGVTRPFDTNGL
jgi:hypothetical protein